MPVVELSLDDDFYHGNSDLSVYSRCTTRLDTQELVSILLDPDLKQEKICKTQPVVVEHNAVFVVDLSALECVKDLNCDDMGSWQSNGVYRAWMDVDSNGFVSSHGKSKPTKSSSSGIYVITKKYYVHKTSKDLKKTIVFLSGMFYTTITVPGWKGLQARVNILQRMRDYLLPVILPLGAAPNR